MPGILSWSRDEGKGYEAARRTGRLSREFQGFGFVDIDGGKEGVDFHEAFLGGVCFGEGMDVGWGDGRGG